MVAQCGRDLVLSPQGWGPSCVLSALLPHVDMDGRAAADLTLGSS